MLVVGEDALCCALGVRLVAACLPNWTLAREPINTRGVTKLVPELARYAQQAKHVQPVLCIADTDGQCAVDWLHRWMPPSADGRLLMRLAVTEAESWLIADRAGLAEAWSVPIAKLPQQPDGEVDPKQLVLSLAARSKRPVIREEVVSRFDRNKPGSGYNAHLTEFVKSDWDVRRASQVSPSLARAVRRLDALGAETLLSDSTWRP